MFKNQLIKNLPQRINEATELFSIPCDYTRVNLGESEIKFEMMVKGKGAGVSQMRGYIKVTIPPTGATASQMERILQTVAVYCPCPTKASRAFRENVELLRWEIRRIISEMYYNSGREEVADEMEEHPMGIWAINSFHENQMSFQDPKGFGTGFIHQSQFKNTKNGIEGKKASSLGLSWR